MKFIISLLGVFFILCVASCAPQPTNVISESNEVSVGVQHAPQQSLVEDAKPSSPSLARKKYAEAPEAQRRDLGTVWGESRSSRITRTSFVRHYPMRPDAVYSLYYNDKVAVESALAAERVPIRETRYVTLAEGIVFSVLDDDDDRMTIHQGARSWLGGTDGKRYSLYFKNSSLLRYEVVSSVDGLDVITGRPAQYSSGGYILEPGKELVITGFRTSDASVAAFRFGNAGVSYAASKGKEAAKNIGVIGIALFREKVELREGANPFPGQNDPRYAQPPR